MENQYKGCSCVRCSFDIITVIRPLSKYKATLTESHLFYKRQMIHSGAARGDRGHVPPPHRMSGAP